MERYGPAGHSKDAGYLPAGLTVSCPLKALGFTWGQARPGVGRAEPEFLPNVNVEVNCHQVNEVLIGLERPLEDHGFLLRGKRYRTHPSEFVVDRHRKTTAQPEHGRLVEYLKLVLREVTQSVIRSPLKRRVARERLRHHRVNALVCSAEIPMFPRAWVGCDDQWAGHYTLGNPQVNKMWQIERFCRCQHGVLKLLLAVRSIQLVDERLNQAVYRSLRSDRLGVSVSLAYGVGKSPHRT